MSLTEDLHTALKAPWEARPPQLRRLRRRALKEGEAVVASLCLHGLAAIEWDLKRRAELQTELVKEYPTSVAYRSLGFTELLLGKVQAACKHFDAALKGLDRNRRDDTLRDLRRLAQKALRRDPKAMADLAEMRASALLDSALIRSRQSPRDGYAGLMAMRRRALREGDETLAARLLGGLAALARTLGDHARELRYARRLARIHPGSWSFELAAEAEGRVGNRERAIKGYELAVETSRREGRRGVRRLHLEIERLRRGIPRQ